MCGRGNGIRGHSFYALHWCQRTGCEPKTQTLITVDNLMSTILPNVAEDRRRVRGPLEKLRGYIRSYVGLEGAAFVVFFLALWFWIGLVFDFGLFKAVGFDGVQEAPWTLRLVVLVTVLGLLL